MKTDKILMPTLVGTTAMTIFSYVVSRMNNKNFREPEILGDLVESMPEGPEKAPAQIAGWGLHYAVGMVFVAAYRKLWKHTKAEPTLATGAVLGLVSGVVGVIGWKAMYEAHPNPPEKKLTPFFGHLILAHVVFGVFSALTYTPTESEEKPRIDE